MYGGWEHFPSSKLHSNPCQSHNRDCLRSHYGSTSNHTRESICCRFRRLPIKRHILIRRWRGFGSSGREYEIVSQDTCSWWPTGSVCQFWKPTTTAGQADSASPVSTQAGEEDTVLRCQSAELPYQTDCVRIWDEDPSPLISTD